MKTYRVAILGCRGRGTAAGRAYHAHPRTEVVALCDLVQERLDTLGDELDVTARFTDLDEMIVQTQPDLVAIPTGTEFHYPLCMRVLEHGVHIEVEKPMCVDQEGTTAVMAKAQEKGVRVAVHHQGRVGALMRAMHKAFTERSDWRTPLHQQPWQSLLRWFRVDEHRHTPTEQYAQVCRSLSQCLRRCADRWSSLSRPKTLSRHRWVWERLQENRSLRHCTSATVLPRISYNTAFRLAQIR